MPDLAEHFVYVNDDVFLGRPRRPEHFFTPGGQYAAFVADHRAVGLPGTDDRPYLSAAQNNRRVLADAFGVTLTHTMMHSPHPQRRTTLEEIAARFPTEVDRTTARAVPLGDRPVAAVVLRPELRPDHRRRRSARARTTATSTSATSSCPVQLKAMLKRDRDFFCVADNLVAAFDEERADGLLHEFLEQYFPIAAPWEHG